MSTRPRSGLRILHLEDDPLDAELVADALERNEPGVTIQRVSSAAAFKRALEAFAPDVVLSDQTIPGMNSLEALRLTQTRRPLSPFLLVAGSFDQVTAKCLKSGAADFVPKAELSRLCPAIAAALRQRAALGELTDRQRQVLQHLAAGDSMREIAKDLRLSVKTVETHRAQLLKRLGIRDLAGLVRYAIRVGLISPE
jgi:DNA-binding NarL/FixJ family response regulator